jgi:hypothetical protein
MTQKTVELIKQTVEKLIKPKQAAAMLELSEQTLANWRCRGVGPAYLKIGRSVRYKEAELAIYAERNRIEPDPNISN